MVGRTSDEAQSCTSERAKCALSNNLHADRYPGKRPPLSSAAEMKSSYVFHSDCILGGRTFGFAISPLKEKAFIPSYAL